MKVYVLTIRQVLDYDILQDSCEVFAKLEDAKKEFNKFLDKERANIEKDDWLIETDTELDFEAYLDGEYTANHTKVSIEEKEVL